MTVAPCGAWAPGDALLMRDVFADFVAGGVEEASGEDVGGFCWFGRGGLRERDGAQQQSDTKSGEGLHEAVVSWIGLGESVSGRGGSCQC